MKSLIMVGSVELRNLTDIRVYHSFYNRAANSMFDDYTIKCQLNFRKDIRDNFELIIDKWTTKYPSMPRTTEESQLLWEEYDTIEHEVYWDFMASVIYKFLKANNMEEVLIVKNYT